MPVLPEFQPAPSFGREVQTAMSTLEGARSMMQRAEDRKREKLLREREDVEYEAIRPIKDAQRQAALSEARTKYDSAISTERARATAYGMLNKATEDFNFINTIEDADARAQASLEWLGRYSQLANIAELKGQVDQMNDIAASNTTTPLKLRTLGGAGLQEFNALTANMTPEEREKAARVRTGIAPRPSSAAITYREVIGPDGTPQLVAVDPRAVGARVIGSGEAYGTGVGEVATPPPGPGAPSTATGAPSANVFRGQSTVQTAQDKTAGTEAAQRKAKLASERPKREYALQKAEVSTKRLEDDIDKLIERATVASTGVGGAILAAFPGTEADNLRQNIESVKASILLEALGDLKAASPTGASGFGSLTEAEGNRLAAQFGSLEASQSPAQFIENAKKVKERIRSNLALTKAAYENEYEGMDKPVEETATISITEMSDAELERRLQELNASKK